MDWMYNHAYANVHRGVYGLAEAATNAYESARLKVARFIGAPDSSEVIFTKNATEALNLVARSWGGANLGPGDAIVLTTMEHHANIVPWQMMAAEKGFEIRWIPLGDDGQLDLTDLDVLLDGAKMLSVTSMSNVLGTITPLDRLISAAHSAGAKVCVDACQSVPHMPTRVDEMGADFVAFSGHKMLGPTGIGVLWGRHELLEAMPPFLGGGGMISNVTTEGFMPDAVPSKFEAGTPPIVEAVGLGAAIDYLEAIGMDHIRQHEIELTSYALRTLSERLGEALTIHGPPSPVQRGGVLSTRSGGRARPRCEPGVGWLRGCGTARTSLCQAAHAGARRQRHRQSELLSLQRHFRCRPSRRRVDRSPPLLRHLD